ncbi:MAG: hypothetical protein HPY57_16165 [Ignavibacteria bacterium]|nr:hypothetical protein [Ignavibacteria bacterium]
MNTLPESTQKYYQTKVNLIYNKIKDKIYSNTKDYEAYMNVPFAKSMIRFKFDFDLEIEQNNVFLSGFNNSISNRNINLMSIDLNKQFLDNNPKSQSISITFFLLYICDNKVLNFIRSKRLLHIVNKLIDHIINYYPNAKIKMDISFDEQDLMVYIVTSQTNFDTYKRFLKTFELRDNDLYKRHVVVVDVNE